MAKRHAICAAALLLAGSVVCAKQESAGGSMALLRPRVQPIRELIRAARAQAAEVVPIEFRQSYPIPVRRPDRSVVAFLYANARAVPREGQYVLPPTVVGAVNAATGVGEGIRPIEFEKLGPQPAGLHALRPGETLAEYQAREQRLYDLYDIVLPSFFANEPRPSPAVRTAAAEFPSLFDSVAEKPLLPFYRTVGQDFFVWLGTAAHGEK